MNIELKALAYVGIEVANLDEWRRFGTDILGLHLSDRSARTASFRMDERLARLRLEQGDADGRVTMGWEVDDAAALSSFCARLDDAGIAFQRGSSALAQQRGVSDLICLRDPAGNAVEVSHGAGISSQPFAPGRSLSGFRTGALGLGHIVLTVADFPRMRNFYEALGFRCTDYITRPFPAWFFHLNARHHSLALIGTGRDGVHHMMMEMTSLDDVGQAYDLALREDGRVAVSLGRHANDLMTSFYAKTPSPLMVEYGWGGKLIDPTAWTATECTVGPDLWGHERSWLPEAARKEALEMRIRAAADGARAPLHVMPGNYEISGG
jgi:2,3-dihydroxybiphenyl 1,2-dioxygenase